MIFVTVGTHEQPFDRLIRKIDELSTYLDEEIIVQYGFSTYIPKYVKSFKMLSYQNMIDYSKKARIVITHGGPGSIMLPLLFDKKPIVVPRQKKYNEHVNDHQLLFSKYLFDNDYIYMITNIDDLFACIKNYQSNLSKINIVEHTKTFNDKFEIEVKKLFEF